MASKQSDELKRLYQEWVATISSSPAISLEEWRDMVEHWAEVTAEPREVDYVETVIAGDMPAMWVRPHGAAQDRVLLCIHGGGFVTGSMFTHRKLFAHCAKAIGVLALIFEYRRAPEYKFPAQLDDAVAAYRWLLEQGISPDQIAVAGDSAGGGLSVSMLLRARELGLPLPAASIPFSPWVDMESTGESMLTNRGKDALFTKESVDRLVTMVLGDGDRRDPYASPLYGDLAGLPPMYIQVGGDELLLDDGRRLAERAKAAGVEVQFDIFPELQHTFHFSAGRAPEADEAIRRIAGWVRPKLGLTADVLHGDVAHADRRF
jgi:monoterpene epsilon-lactone hydrolase